MKCAVVDQEGNVTNIIVADPRVDSVEGASLIPVGDNEPVDTRWKYDEANGYFVLTQISIPPVLEG